MEGVNKMLEVHIAGSTFITYEVTMVENAGRRK
jgi:hypothetical protein